MLWKFVKFCIHKTRNPKSTWQFARKLPPNGIASCQGKRQGYHATETGKEEDGERETASGVLAEGRECGVDVKFLFDFHTQTTASKRGNGATVHTKAFFSAAGICDSFIGFPYTPKAI